MVLILYRQLISHFLIAQHIYRVLVVYHHNSHAIGALKHTVAPMIQLIIVEMTP